MKIKEILKENHITQQELADKMGVSLSAVKQMLGADSLTTATLEKISSALNVPIWRFFVSPADIIQQRNTDALGETISCPHCGKPLKITAG